MAAGELRIAYVIDDLSYGGAQKQLFLLASALPPTHVPVVLCLSNLSEPFAPLLRSRGIEVDVLPRRAHYDMARLARIGVLLRRRRIDVVHGFLDAANGYAYVAARAVRRPVVLSLQSDRIRMAGPNGRVLRWMLRRADRVTVNSRAGEKYLYEEVRVPLQKVAHVQNWIRVPDTPRAVDFSTPPVVGYIGRFSDEKRVDRLLDGFFRLQQQMPECRLVLMGSGPARPSLIARSQDLGLGGRVEFVEPAPDVEPVLRRLDVFVLPSRFEGLPNAAIEALAMGVPLIATPVGDLPTLVLAGKTGLLLDDDDPQTIATALQRLLQNRELRNDACVEGPRLVRSMFSISHALETLVPIYGRLAQSDARA